MHRVYYIASLLSFACAAEMYAASFSVVSLDLVSGVVDSSGFPTVDDVEFIDTISNPLIATTTGSIGNNIASSSYNFSWLEEAGIGDFHTTFNHEMRFSSDIRTLTGVDIVIATTADVMVAFHGSLDYSHTPGDFTDIGFRYSVAEVDPLEVLINENVEGGNGDFLPASGTLDLMGETILPAGTSYRLSASTDNFNFLIGEPVGVYDVEGFATFTIRPVPEPMTAILLLPALSLLRRVRN